MPAADFLSHVDQLLKQPGTALRRELFGPEWSHTDENIARLYEGQDHSVRHDWVDRTTDPDDPEVKRARALEKRSGRRPPARPVIEPTALRPPEWAEYRAEQWRQEIEAASPVRTERQFVTLSEFEAKFC